MLLSDNANVTHSVRIWQSVVEVQRRFPDGVPLLDPVKDMRIKSDSLREVVEKIAVMEGKYYQHSLRKADDAESRVALYAKKLDLAAQIKIARKEIRKSQSVLKVRGCLNSTGTLCPKIAFNFAGPLAVCRSRFPPIISAFLVFF